MQSPRLAVKAIIIKDNQVLTIKKMGKAGDYHHLLPGGGQEKGETIIEALQRECREEIGVEVVINKMQFVREYISANHSRDKYHHNFHQVELMFTCHLQTGETLKAGSNPDTNQVDIVWVNLQELDNISFLPSALKHHLTNETSLTAPMPIYLGDVD